MATSEGVEKIIIEVPGQKKIVLHKKDIWRLVEPVQYPVDAGLMEQSLTVIRQVLADTKFPLEEDLYGFSQSKTRLELVYGADRKVFVLGEKKAPGSNLYILDEGSQTVFVVNNVWGQFFYKNYKDYMVKDVYIATRDVDWARWSEGKTEIWRTERTGLRSWRYFSEGKEKEIKREPIGGLFGSLHKIKIHDVLFQYKEQDFSHALSLKLKGGEQIELGVNKEKTMISLPHLKVVAKVEPSSVRYFLNEIKRAAKSGNKSKVTDKN